MGDGVQHLALISGSIGAVTASICTIVPTIVYPLLVRGKKSSSPIRHTWARVIGYGILGIVFGLFMGCIVGFISGAYVTQDEPSMLYGPLIGAMYGACGGSIGGFIGSIVRIPK